MFTFDFILFGLTYYVDSLSDGDVRVSCYIRSADEASPFFMSLKDFRDIYGSCSVVGCDHLTLGDYLPLA